MSQKPIELLPVWSTRVFLLGLMIGALLMATVFALGRPGRSIDLTTSDPHPHFGPYRCVDGRIEFVEGGLYPLEECHALSERAKR